MTPGITSVAVNQDSGSLFVVEPRASGGYAGVVITVADGKQSRVFESMVGGWRSQWVHDVLYVVQKATQGVRGSAYKINTKNQMVTPIIEDVSGLSVTFGPSDRYAVYSESYIGSLTTFLQTPTSTKRLSIQTLGEKCAWSPQGAYVICAVPAGLGDQPLPDSWYDGETHFSDSLWKIQTESGEVEELANLSSFFGNPIDVIDPHIDDSGMFLSFIDKNSGMPWVLRTNEI